MATVSALEIAPKNDFLEMMHDPITVQRFTAMMGDSGMRYIQSVVILVGTDPKLQKCTPLSIVRSALRAAACELSVDPAYRQAYLIARGRHVKYVPARGGNPEIPEQWIQEAHFQPHYNGLLTLAERTGLYWVINVSPIYRGQRVMENVLTGLHSFTVGEGSATLAVPDQVSYLRDVTNGRGEPEDIIGYLGYFKTKKGFEKTVWMSSKQIEDHAMRYSDAYKSGNSTLWAKGNPHRPTMEMKTVFIALTKFMDLSGSINAKLRDAVMASDEADDQRESDRDEQIYETDEFSQVAPGPIPTIPMVVTPAPTSASSAPAQPAPLPSVGGPIGTTDYNRPGVASSPSHKGLKYEIAKDYVIGTKRLGDMTIDELETAGQNPKLTSQRMLEAIRVVKGRKVEEAMKAEGKRV